MDDTTTATARSDIPPELMPPRATWLSVLSRSGAVIALAMVLAWSFRGAEVRPLELLKHSENMLEYAKGFARPDFTDWRDYVKEMLVTIQIAIWGTFLAVLCAVPCGLLSSANIVPWWVHQPVRRLMDMLRSINEMIFALLFISAVGLGPFAGVLALFVHTLGTLSKLFSEAVEAIDPRPVEGIRATGSDVISEIVYGVIPQVMPLWISYTLYRFESNVRSASVVGMVGAGGIGMLLWDAIRGFQYERTSAMLLIVIVSVSLLDIVSAQIRKRFI
jgi:phosphonate transport system permease protein